MPYYLHQWRYKDEQVRRNVVEGRDRSEVVRIAIQAYGGTLVAFYYCFGEYDGVAISSFPDAESALASMLTSSADGRFTCMRTTPLFSAEEGLRAMKLARDTFQ